jgi:hypothetical protein
MVAIDDAAFPHGMRKAASARAAVGDMRQV